MLSLVFHDYELLFLILEVFEVWTIELKLLNNRTSKHFVALENIKKKVAWWILEIVLCSEFTV